MSGTCQAAGSGISLANGEPARDGLGILFVGGFMEGQSFIVSVQKIHGTDLRAFAASRAFGQIDKTGGLSQGGGKITGLAADIKQFRIREDLYVQVPADLDQFG
jgi:hypothetical protein